MREGHWSDLAVHCGLFAGPARSLFVAAYRIDGSQGKLSWLAVEVFRTSVKLDDAPEVNSFSHECYQALSSPCFLRREPGTAAT